MINLANKWDHLSYWACTVEGKTNVMLDWEEFKELEVEILIKCQDQASGLQRRWKVRLYTVACIWVLTMYLLSQERASVWCSLGAFHSFPQRVLITLSCYFCGRHMIRAMERCLYNILWDGFLQWHCKNTDGEIVSERLRNTLQLKRLVNGRKRVKLRSV